jgi:hypothetical protein
MTIDERIEALTMNLELAHRDIQDLQAAANKDGENIRHLALIAQDLQAAVSPSGPSKTPPVRTNSGWTIWKASGLRICHEITTPTAPLRSLTVAARNPILSRDRKGAGYFPSPAAVPCPNIPLCRSHFSASAGQPVMGRSVGRSP